MPEDNRICPTCGQEWGGAGADASPPLPENPVVVRAEGHVQRQAALLDRISSQLDRLLESVRESADTPEQLLEKLEGLRQLLHPRHGLCTDRGCGLCRLQEEAIKEHVLLYVDWKVPGTIAKLEEARQGQ